MHGLPDQSLEEALDDLRQAIALNPPHLSWYQLTIEPNTLFGSRPPVLPDDDALWDIFEQGISCRAPPAISSTRRPPMLSGLPVSA